MYITYGKVFGETPKNFMFWLFPENGSISERTVNRAFNSSYNSIKFCINKKKKKKKKKKIIFAMYQNYPLALRMHSKFHKFAVACQKLYENVCP